MNINERQRDRRREHTPGGAMTALFKEKGRSNRERSRLLRLAKGKNVKRGSNPQSDEPDREDSQTMLDIKDKIAETLLNSFNELLNEGGRSSVQRTANRTERQAVKSGRFNLGSAESMARNNRNNARFRRRSKAAAKAILKLNPGEGARQDAEEVVRRTKS